MRRRKIKFSKPKKKEDASSVAEAVVGNYGSNNQVDQEKLQKIRKIVSPEIKYTKIKYKQDIYSIGDNLLIRDSADGFLIARLLNIIPANGDRKYHYWPTIEVEWLYKKTDINREKNGLSSDEKYNSISEFEVFKSNHHDVIFIETIISACTIVTFEEYEKLDIHTSTTFFCRASYDPATELIDPTFDSWERSCVCDNPLNPDQLYIKCDACEKWYHPEHCGISKEEAEKLSEFYCVKCKK